MSTEPPTYKSIKQDNDNSSPFPGEKNRLACNYPTGEDNLLVGIHDNNKFEVREETTTLRCCGCQLW